MTRFFVLYFIAFTSLSALAQTGRHTHKPTKGSPPIQPLAGKSFVPPKVPTGGPVLALVATPTSKLTTAATSPPITDKAKSVSVTADGSATPVRVANPALLESIRAKPYLLPIDRSAVKGSYPLGISDRKTTHLIFPAKIQDRAAGAVRCRDGLRAGAGSRNRDERAAGKGESEGHRLLPP